MESMKFLKFCFSLWNLILITGVFKGVISQRSTCDESSCYPATGDLLIGREDRLSATSTCGLHRAERYCIVSHLEDKKKCFYCSNDSPQRSHGVENIVAKIGPLNRKDKWWQAENGVENVSVRLDLEAEFHFTHLIITFKTFRPAAMLIERSHDFGKTWNVYRYFAYDCHESFPGISTAEPKQITDVTCSSRYSNVAPSTEGEVIFRVLIPNVDINDPYSQTVQNLLKVTNLRINFTQLHTLGDNLLDSRQEIRQKYYYAIYEMVVRGSCSCYGHASNCIPQSGEREKVGMVYGKCNCTHNTHGLNCEQCLDFFNDQPWRPAIGRTTNACQVCNCNDHATRCHFDPAVYEATGRVSGGVCDDCLHNTMGRNCEQCKPYFYQDPQRDLRDPYICQPCDCDPNGSVNDGICDGYSDSATSLVAGRCHCKRFVDGPRCDTCRNGFWNLRLDNQVGCDQCRCNVLGTVGNAGCDKYTGICTCKRYVTGRDCNECLPGSWGLSEERDGCKPCDCDIGGSIGSDCDVTTGQCRCRPNVIGRRCDRPSPGFFAPYLDYYTFEAESASGQNIRIVEREPFPDRPITWSGVGFVQVHEGAVLEFIVDVATSLDYDIIIRYEPQLPERWEDVRVTIERPSPIDPTGSCGNTIPQDDRKIAYLNPQERFHVVQPPVCLEGGVRYKLKLEFAHYTSHRDTPTATALIDSVVLYPNIESIPFFQGPGEVLKENFLRFYCRDSQIQVYKQDLNDLCRNYTNSISLFVHGQAIDCGCDDTGSYSRICNTLGGQCQCKRNVIGRTCTHCAPGSFGFGPQGCSACECNNVGARDNFCDQQTGQCVCRPNNAGRQCDSCFPGFWNHPICQNCECNGHAESCDQRTGQCIACRDNTAGQKCDRCIEGYYGDPRLGVGIPCRPCPCPGEAGSGFNHAESCYLDSFTQNVVCRCKEGYTGARCEYCSENYWGNPQVPGGTCQKCFCNNNVDFTDYGVCESKTGECKKCLYNTEGYYCEHCRNGYYGNAIQQDCKSCICNLLGTVPDSVCHRETGQCVCHPNVVGKTCDRCAPNHWRLALGQGCESCDCSPDGSLSLKCNEYDGQCSCRPGRGGRTCADCEAYHWGDPFVECYPCSCSREGSATLQCHAGNGSCVCIPGVDGIKCDRCKRGWTGTVPYCAPCGECFDNWDDIINDLRVETEHLIEKVRDLKQTGIPGAYEDDFQDMEKKLNRVREILLAANVTIEDVDRLQDEVNMIKNNLTGSGELLAGIDYDLDNTSRRIDDALAALADLRLKAEHLKKDAQDLKDNATALQLANVEGAKNITEDAERRSKAAYDKVLGTDHIIGRSEDERARVEDLISKEYTNFVDKYPKINGTFNALHNKLQYLEDQIPDINDLVCDGHGDPCHSICGGGGCGKCGGLSCDKGAVTKAENALELAKALESKMRGLEVEAKDLLNNVQGAEKDASDAEREAQLAHDKALEAKNQSEGLQSEAVELLQRINDFLNENHAKPKDVRSLAEEVLNMSISLKPEQIEELAKQINDTINNLTNIDAVLADSKDDLDMAEELKRRADQAKENAEDILDIAQKVLDALKKAKEAQNKAEESIETASDDIGIAEANLATINSEIKSAGERANNSLNEIEGLKIRLHELRKKFIENENQVKKANIEAATAEKLADQAQKNASDLVDKYDEASHLIESKAGGSENAKRLADELKGRASKLFQDTQAKLEDLRDMEVKFKDNDVKLNNLSDQIMKLDQEVSRYLATITQRAAHLRDCQTA